MSSGWSGSRRFRFDEAHELPAEPEIAAPRTSLQEPQTGQWPRLQAAIGRTRDYLLEHQAPAGYWVGELEGDTILESEYILLLAYLGRGQSEIALQAANYIARQQLPGGGWAIYPGGDLEISASVKAYWALKITGHRADEPGMIRAREAILAAGGAEGVNSFTRYYFALLGAISYAQCPAVPPEIILLPPWCPFNIYEMSAWSRTILIPLSLLWAFKPRHELPESQQFRELFRKSPEELPTTMPPSAAVDALKRPSWVNWHVVFDRVDRGLKLLDRWKMTPLRSEAIRRASAWMQARFADSDGLGAIFPPIVWSIVALKCLGHADDSPDVLRALHELEKLSIREGDTIRLQPCKSPVWDTAIATIALREAGVSSQSPAIRGAVDWLLAREVRETGDWSVRRPAAEPSGWFFEFENRFYPDIDDTSMVVMALTRSLPETEQSKWLAEFRFGEPTGLATTIESSTVLARRDPVAGTGAVAEIEAMRPLLNSISRGARWIMAMQNRDGGWGAFDNNNDRELFTRVPFADHNAMIDPSTADLTARNLEMFAGLGMPADHPIALRAFDFLWREQEPDGCWFGRWGVNYIYGTWQALVGLTAIGTPQSSLRIRRAVKWLKAAQHESGGWGESPRSYDEPALRGQGEPTASQTAWAIMGLLAAGEVHSVAVEAGVQFLLDTQREDGTWDERPYTGTGFPKVFYLKYHLYRIYFPLMALARAARMRHADATPEL